MPSSRAKRSDPGERRASHVPLDCFVAPLLAMTMPSDRDTLRSRRARQARMSAPQALFLPSNGSPSPVEETLATRPFSSLEVARQEPWIDMPTPLTIGIERSSVRALVVL